MSKSNKYGYSGVDIPTQVAFANVGKFDPSEINELVQEDKWTTFGQLELIQTEVSSSNATAIEFTNLKENEYTIHMFVFNNVKSNSAGQLSFNVYTEQYGYDTNAHYSTHTQRCFSTGSFNEWRQHNSAYNYVSGTPLSDQTDQAMNGYMLMYHAGDTTNYTEFNNHIIGAHSTSIYSYSEFGGLTYNKYGYAITKLKFKIGGGTTQFTDGSTISLYGIKRY